MAEPDYRRDSGAILPWRALLVAGSLLSAVASQPAAACIQDSDTLEDERITSPKMAAAILDEPPKPDVARLRERIAKLEADRREDDPKWWNDLAGAHIRLGESDKAAALLEPLRTRFPKDYGIHANLGTAYHLLGRYAEAEREIARDLEINPKAHFGLERYHLALLQYLTRDNAYQSKHVYVDEWSDAFQSDHFESDANSVTFQADRSNTGKLRTQLLELSPKLTSLTETPPAYRKRWNLVSDDKFDEGVIYMASLNRQQPAAWVMLGIASVANGDFNLAVAAYRRAIELDGPQTELLRTHLRRAEEVAHQNDQKPNAMLWGLVAAGALPILVPLALWYLLRGRRIFARRRARGRPSLPLEGS